MVGPRPQPPLSANHGGPQPRLPQPDMPQHPCSHSRRKMCRRCRSTSAAASIFSRASRSRARRSPTAPTSCAGCAAPPSAASRSRAPSSSPRAPRLPRAARDRSPARRLLCSVTGVPTTVSGIHSNAGDASRLGRAPRVCCLDVHGDACDTDVADSTMFADHSAGRRLTLRDEVSAPACPPGDLRARERSRVDSHTPLGRETRAERLRRVRGAAHRRPERTDGPDGLDISQ